MPMLRLLALAALLLVAGCSSSSSYGGPPPPPPPPGPPPPPPPPGGGHSTTITVANNSFSPTPDTVAAGTVTFSWAANAVTHTVNWDTGPMPLPPNSGDKAANDSYDASVTAGTYTYHCIHHAGMNGTLVVQ